MGTTYVEIEWFVPETGRQFQLKGFKRYKIGVALFDETTLTFGAELRTVLFAAEEYPGTGSVLLPQPITFFLGGRFRTSSRKQREAFCFWLSCSTRSCKPTPSRCVFTSIRGWERLRSGYGIANDSVLGVRFSNSSSEEP